MKKKLILAGAIFTTTALLQAQTVIGNFESGSFDTWTTGSSTLSFDTIGTTLGSSSLKVVAPGNWNVGLSRSSMDIFSLLTQAGTTISLDITARNDDNSIPSWWLGNEIVLNSDAGWFGLGGQSTPIGWGPQTTTETYTVSGPTAAALAAATWVDVLLINNTGSAGAAIYIDNVVVTAVPEPGATALLGVGLSALIFVRRAARR